ncbi:unnamed protein product [Moneuplotes crassus]|uniref:Uncharacterized protein n=1 Tax=Euplotes crassus TaxID=5936 RepID=A0AAD1X5U7_EUPCR|nr:unnamed protein product [Moneuplotes crassus]
MEDCIYRDKNIRTFLGPIREKEVNYIVRELCLLGIQVFKEKNQGITHYSLENVKKCRQEYVEECKTHTYYQRYAKNTIENEADGLLDAERSNAYGQDKFKENKNRHLHSQGDLYNGGFDHLNNSEYSRNYSQKSNRNHKSREVDSTQGESQEDGQGEVLQKEEIYYQRSRSNSYEEKSNFPPNGRRNTSNFNSLNPEFTRDLNAVVDHRVRSSSKDRQAQVVTTLDRSMKYSSELPYKGGKTSPLKSCIQNAEVKVSRGGVAIAFDPWKQSKKKSVKRSHTNRNVEQEYFYDRICDNEDIRIADGHFFNSQVKSPGVKPRVDPQVERLAKRDMKIALKKRQKYENKRRAMKKSAKSKNEKYYKKERRNKSPYKNVQSKIKLSVMKDKSRARRRSITGPIGRKSKSVTKSFTQREVKHSDHYPPGLHHEHSFNGISDSMNGHPVIDHSRTAIFGQREDSFTGDVHYIDDGRDVELRNHHPTFGGHDPSRNDFKSDSNYEMMNFDLNERNRDNSSLKYRSLRCPYEGIPNAHTDSDLVNSPENPIHSRMPMHAPILPYRR